MTFLRELLSRMPMLFSLPYDRMFFTMLLAETFKSFIDAFAVPAMLLFFDYAPADVDHAYAVKGALRRNAVYAYVCTSLTR